MERNREKQKETKSVLEKIFDNISKYYSNSHNEAKILSIKQDIAGIWSLMKSIVSFNNVFDKQYWIFRLAMILMIVNNDLDKYIKKIKTNTN